jgi:hypothetical protein
MTAQEKPLATRLAELERGTSSTAALAFYDTLPAVSLEQMPGRWRGSELATSHPLDGLLTKAGWYGKRFDGPDDADPLLFSRRDGSLFAVDPAWIPIGLMTWGLGLSQRIATPGLVRAAALIAGATQPKARLRMTEFRGVVSATMIYDALPINDVFRAVDRDTLVGAMDMRGHEAPFMFVLRREI